MNRFFRIAFSATIGVLMFACKKDSPLVPPVESSSDSLVFQSISGQVVLPAGVSETGIRVNSGRSDSAVVGGQYNTEVLQDDFGIQMLRNAAGEEILMGYTYPGQTDFTINAKSTITAIMMMMPDVQWLNKEGKLSFIQDIHNSPKLAAAISQLETDLAGGGILFDTSHVEFMNRISELYGEAAGQKISSGPESVKFSRENKQVMIENANGKPFSHCVGVYKNGQKTMPSFIIDRYKFFASSYDELLSRAAGSIPIEVSGKIIPLESDGRYDFKIRTGKPFSGAEGFESQQAFVENGTNFVMDNLAPTLKVLNLNNKCLGAIRSSAINSFQNIQGIVQEDNQSSWRLFKKMVLVIAGSTIEIAKSAIDCQKPTQLPNTYQALFAESMKNFYNWFDNVALVLNNGNLIIQYCSYPAIQDTCLIVNGNSVVPCCPATVTDIDGNTYKTVKIGDQCWMKENLKVSRYQNGIAIPNISEDSIWCKNKTGAMACLNNLPELCNSPPGKFYNYYAAINTNKLCPAGWHLPTEEEWSTLINFLGGSEVAGTKMKVPEGWDVIPGTNESGFSGIGAGIRYGAESSGFDRYNHWGVWWSSSNSGLISGRFSSIILYCDWEGAQIIPRAPDSGLNVRCVKD